MSLELKYMGLILSPGGILDLPSGPDSFLLALSLAIHYYAFCRIRRWPYLLKVRIDQDFMFNIAAPFVRVSDVEVLKQSGADELYCGYIDADAEARWPTSFLTINRRGYRSNFSDFDTFREAMAAAEARGLPVYVTMNSFFSEEQYPWLLKAIDRVSKFPAVKGVILSDLGMMHLLRKKGFPKKIHMSTCATTFNHMTADFYYSLGASRAIVDRQLSVSELKELGALKTTPIEIEVFALFGSCTFVDGYCMFCHYVDHDTRVHTGTSGKAYANTFNSEMTSFGCQEIFTILGRGDFKIHSTKLGNVRAHPDCGQTTFKKRCGLCTLYDLKDWNGLVLKVVGRGMEVANAVRMVRDLTHRLLRGDIKRREYEKHAQKIYQITTGMLCQKSCYYSYGKGTVRKQRGSKRVGRGL